MTVAELIAALQKMPPEARVCVRDHMDDTGECWGHDDAVDVEEVLAPKAPGNWWDDGQWVMIRGGW